MRIPWLALGIAALICVLAASAVTADGIGDVRVMEQPVGRYLVTVTTNPSPLTVGAVDIGVLVQTGQDKTTVLNAKVTAAAAGDSTTLGPVDAPLGSLPNRLLYGGRLVLPNPGVWTFTITVAGPDGSGTVHFTADAQQPANPWLPIALLLLAPSALVVLGALARSRKPKPTAKGEPAHNERQHRLGT